jgi:SAM-dependent methyltransferase
VSSAEPHARVDSVPVMPSGSSDWPGGAALIRRALSRGYALAERAVAGPPEAVLDIAYRAIFQRSPDRYARRDYLPALRRGELTAETLGRRLIDSREFEALSASRDLGLSLHRSRCAFVRSLPPARRILDLGGTDLGHEHGAMLTMGYPYRFEELVIVDLPPDDRHEIYNRGGTHPDVDTGRGTVRYAYHSMTDLSPYEDESFDLVYSGQSIEHVPVDAADVMLKSALRVLRPGGWLAVDTPNARMTRLQQEALIDPDHTYEYRPDELRDKLVAAGFVVTEEKGLNLGRDCLDAGRFDATELARSVGVFADVEACYLMAFVCRKLPG